jgi:hypothetical protein
MPRLDARWDNFWQRGQIWYHFDQDILSNERTGIVSVSHSHSVVVTGSKAVSGSTSVSHGHSVTLSGQRTFSDTVTVSHGHSVILAGQKGGIGAVSVSHPASVVTSGGEATRSGTVSVSHPATVDLLGRKAAYGSLTVSAAHLVVADGYKTSGEAHSGSTAVSHGHSVSLAGFGYMPWEQTLQPALRTYHGESMAVHVTTDSFSATPSSPEQDISTYHGLSPSIASNQASPDQWDDDQVMGTGFMSGIYRGRSPAIHVYGGLPSKWPPVEPIPGCECETEGITDTYTRTVSNGWGTCDAGLTWTGSSPSLSVNGSVGHILDTYSEGGYGQTVTATLQSLPSQPGPEWSFRVSISFSIVDANEPYIELGEWGHVILVPTTSGGVMGIGSGAGYDEVAYTCSSGVTYDIHYEGDGAYQACRANIWVHGTTEPSGWMVTGTTTHGRGSTFAVSYSSSTDRYPTVGTVTIDNLDISGVGSEGCPECDDPYNPGHQIPPFTPGYLPTFRYQIGDPTTDLDSYICVLESAAMVLDWHTRGAISVWGGELVPWCGKSRYDIIHDPGTGVWNAYYAWRHFGQYLDVRAGTHWHDLMACLAEGRAVILIGDYDQFTLAERCQDTFLGNHGISVYPYQVADRLLIGDPLCRNFRNIKESSLQAYAEDYGIQIYGVTSPQKIVFAVSRPWAP